MSTPLYPLLLEPSLHTKVWGGRRLADLLNKNLPTNEPYGEAWELHDTATVVNGALAGKTVAQVLASHGTDLVGAHNDPAAGFPLLAKFLDANDWLSVQVHPNDEQAAELEGEPRGKTEAWFVLHAEAYAKLIIGVEPGTDREAIATAIKETRLEDVLVSADVKAGDMLYLEANTVHALGPGIVIYEIQQSSDTTYRLYDWGRTGLDGKPRELHIEKGVQVSNVAYLPEITHHGDDNTPVVTLAKGPYFTTNLHTLDGQQPLTLNTDGQFFHGLTCIAGELSVEADGHESVIIGTGRTVLIPANLGEYTLKGTAKVLRSWQTSA